MFVRDKYDNSTDRLLQEVMKSYDFNVYICLTCHKKLLKKEVPCHSACNKLELYAFPNALNNMIKLEPILISQYVLFSKVLNMHKGKFPKLRGTICNIPTCVPRSSTWKW